MEAIDVTIIRSYTQLILDVSLNWTKSAVEINGESTITATLIKEDRTVHTLWANLHGVIVGGRGLLVGGLRRGFQSIRHGS